MTTTTRESRLPGWLRPPKPSEDGSMALGDHLRELRYRLIVSMVAILLTTLVALIFYDYLMQLALSPIEQAIAAYQAKRPNADVVLSTDGVMGAFVLYFKVCFTAGFIVACPIWLYQLWAFIAPGLLANEKRVALRFLGAAIPLFLLGVVTGYLITPKGFAVMMQFNPDGVTNINELNNFLNFELRLLLVFGVSFLLPVVLITLNRLGVVKATQLTRFRSLAIFLCFVFAAIATPSADAISMLALSLPMAAMYVLSEVICHRHDRKKAARDDLATDD